MGASGCGFYRVVAVDFDGTLTSGGPPDGAVLAALDAARHRGVKLVLVTGRIVTELLEVWPDATASFDGLVVENGAVLATRSWRKLLAAPVEAQLDAALRRQGVPFRRGDVLLAAAAADEPAILAQIRNLGLGCQTVANRGELMILPAGVSKGTGLYHALGELGLSYHNAIAVGDAENDHALLDVSELAVAVANAVDALKGHADVVLDQPDGAGVAQLLNGDLLAGRRIVHSRRWQLTLGAAADGAPVRLPASQINVLVAGGTGEGKSYLAGLVAEQLVLQGYSLLVVDPEGDHVGLSHLHGVLVVGGRLRLPHPDEVLRLLSHRYASVVVDLSGLDAATAADYESGLLTRVEAHRHATGLPHWVLLDEAHRALGRVAVSTSVFEPWQKGYCLITWRPADLALDAVMSLDAVVAAGSPDPDPAVVDLAASIAGLPRSEVAHLLTDRAGSAVLTRRDAPGRAEPFTPARRVTPHLRHTHKYDLHPLEHARRFHFRRNPAELTGARAGNLAELVDELSSCEEGVLRHHCARHDFSRWVADVFHDGALAARLADTESSLADTSPAAVVEQTRLELINALEDRLMG